MSLVVLLGALRASSLPTVNVLGKVTFKHIYTLHLIKDARQTHLGNLILRRMAWSFMGDHPLREDEVTIVESEEETLTDHLMACKGGLGKE